MFETAVVRAGLVEASAFNAGGLDRDKDLTTRPNQTITAVGLSERTLAALTLFCKLRFGNRFAFGDPKDADVWLYDLDAESGRIAWSAHLKERQGVSAILISENESDAVQPDYATFLPKPLSAAALREALVQVTARSPKPAVLIPATPIAPKAEAARRPTTTDGDASRDVADARGSDSTPFRGLALRDGAGPDPLPVDGCRTTETEERTASPASCRAAVLKLDEQLSRAFIGSTEDIDAKDPEQWAKVQFNPDDFLAGALSQAIELTENVQGPVRVTQKDWTIVVLPDLDRAFVDIGKLSLRSLASVPLPPEIETEILEPFTSARAFPGVEWYLPALQWTLTLMAARGRLPAGADIAAKVRLKYWPNLTRLQLFPHATRIAALWSKRPMSLVESAAELAIPQRFVFSFYSAALALGSLECLASGQPAANGAARDCGKSRSGLFNRVRARMRRG